MSNQSKVSGQLVGRRPRKDRHGAWRRFTLSQRNRLRREMRKVGRTNAGLARLIARTFGFGGTHG